MPSSGRAMPRLHVSNLRFEVTKSQIRTAVYDYAGVYDSLKDIQLVRMDEDTWRPEHCSCFLKFDNVARMRDVSSVNISYVVDFCFFSLRFCFQCARGFRCGVGAAQAPPSLR